MEEQVQKEQEEEQLYKVYDSLFNVIGVEDYESVHKNGLFHQVVHFWLLEKGSNGLWLYIQKRPEEDPVYKGAYDILTSGHIDPEESHEDALVHQVKEKLGLVLQKDQMKYIGHINQRIDSGKYHDHAFVQSFLCETNHPETQFSDVERVLKVKYEDMKSFCAKQQENIAVYTTSGTPFSTPSHEQWWLREEEFVELVIPYVEKYYISASIF